MSEVRISAEPRTDFGKGGARRTRRAGKVPAVVYGHGEKPRHISLPGLELAAVLRKGGLNQLIEVQVTDGSRELVIPKDIQRDALKDHIVHADLIIVRRGEKITTDVYISWTGEVEKGGLVVHEHDSLTVEAEATAIPESLEVSLEGLAVGAQRTAGEVVLPEGTVLVTDPETVLASVTVPRAEAAAETEAEAAEGETPAAE
ncbi:50S ribosomal protein L25/general stress protein Ctc [Glycomyces buryatensis]|uniref:Large ribosomal subunit protein bL25 n=1 Tax=Glycomyces buryatensis TaxID=2570927 RepID=A0A4S8QN43_9ACTN|nr:50S ribosomal protein L25/general stress protein Ctc [Glycomyces buryatensis]THV42869.1 50S ribosomal protein L25/general stress protein Ctc [Glycomyces buryatensis]